MSEDKRKEAIFSFVKRHHDELKESVQQEDFADLLNEVYRSVQPNNSVKSRVRDIRNEMKTDDDGEGIDASDFIATDVDAYLERMVKYIDQQTKPKDRSRSRSRSKRVDLDDPLDRNILKPLNSSSSSSDDDRGGRLHIKKRDHVQKKDNRDNRYNKDVKDNNRRGQKQNNKYQNNRGGNQDQDTKALLQQMLYKLQNKSGLNIHEMLKNFQGAGNHENRNRKDTVFLVNLPREYRSIQEISEIFKNKGDISNVNLNGKVPSVQFKKMQDAQNLINNTKYIVYKGLKLDLSGTPNRNRQRREEGGETQIRIIKKEENKVDDEAQKQQQHQVQHQPQVAPETLESNEQEVKPNPGALAKVDKQIEICRSNINTVLAEKMRTILFLQRRDYPADIKEEILTRKQNLVPLKDQIKVNENLESLKQLLQSLSAILDHTLLIKDIPQEYFANKSIMVKLNEHFATFGKIESLSLRLKEQTAVLKFFNFESAEKVYNSFKLHQSKQTPQPFTLEFQDPSITKYLRPISID